MRKKNSLLFLLIFIVQLCVLGVNADPTTTISENETLTTTIVESETIDLDWYYLYQVNEETPVKDTQVVVNILSSASIDFFVADEGDTDDYLDGESIYVYIDVRNITDDTLSFTLESKQMYEFVFENSGDHGLDATVTFSITFIYESSSLGDKYTWIIWVIIGIAVIGMIVFFSNRRKRQQIYKPAYQPYQPYAPTQQTVESSGYKPAQTQITQDTLMAKYCTNCGAQNDDNASYCTSCGSSIN